jgi:hypothetical protein
LFLFLLFFFYFFYSSFLCYCPCYNNYHCYYYYYFKGIFTPCSSPCTFKKKVTSFLSLLTFIFIFVSSFIRRRVWFFFSLLANFYYSCVSLFRVCLRIHIFLCDFPQVLFNHRKIPAPIRNKSLPLCVVCCRPTHTL